jgi:hypothetical protein
MAIFQHQVGPAYTIKVGPAYAIISRPLVVGLLVVPTILTTCVHFYKFFIRAVSDVAEKDAKAVMAEL